ncbi:extensin family protein [Phenylobacterium sp.]|uniref:extensin-like domain-containing protein n=1 Tax=Phenylobacterium sp. TaxID=1871053 RepID=UPI0025CC3711|nr:extensin family protein [Phenylobacterium sp.]
MSPEVLALAGAWSLLTDLLVMSLLLGVAIARWAPPEDLPWTPLRLDQPVGLATGFKFALAARDPRQCRLVLREGGLGFVEEPGRVRGACSTHNTLRLQGAQLSPAAPVMTCPEALAYAFWIRHAVQPAAHANLGEPVVTVEHYGSFACRNIYGRATGMRSEHAYANALDVSAFRTISGRRVSVLEDFNDQGARGRFLRRARDGACPWFNAVLGPDYNAAHRDHLHLDMGRFAACR